MLPIRGGGFVAKRKILQLRAKLIAIRHELLEARAQHILDYRYDPSQPRVPAGSSGGGRWTDGTGATAQAPARYRDAAVRAEDQSDVPRAGRLTIASRKRLAECERQFERDIFHCNMVGLTACYSQDMVRKVACEKGHPIPPLNY